MDPKPKQSKRRDNVLSSLSVIIEALTVAANLSSITPAKAAFSTVSVILAMIKDSMVNEDDYVDLGLTCNTVCAALDRGLKGKRLSELSGSMVDAISQLTTTLADIRSKVTERSKQNAISRAFHAKNDAQAIASWRMNLNRVLLVFNTELGLNIYTTVSGVRDGVMMTHTAIADTRSAVSKVQRDVADTHTTVVDTHTVVAEVQRDVVGTHAIVSDIRRQMLGSQGGADNNRPQLNQTSIPGESPPPAPRACFGRDGLIDEIVGMVECLTPIALIGPGGIGKTSIALKALHHTRVKRRFGPNRRFIRCDQFPASHTHLLSRISKAVGAGIENPEDLASLRPFLSSSEMVIVLDNAESILDPEGPNAGEINGIVEELCQLDNICLCITSRISAVPPDCETLEVPTLSIGAARDAFYRICKNIGRSDLIDDMLVQLDFHPLSITLLATVAHQNKWDTERLTKEWERQRTRMLQTMHNKSFATAIELSLTSPMFQELGPDARALLEVVAFFPQGIDENNLEWLLPTISNGSHIFDKFCVLSLTYRSNSFVTMLAPLRDHLRPKDPESSALLCMTKERYFARMSAIPTPGDPGFGESGWIVSEDVNVEHLLDVFTTIDADSEGVWNSCADFIYLLVSHKQRLTILQPKVERLPDHNPSKPGCLFELSQLFQTVGNQVERRRLLTDTLKLQKEQGDDSEIARTLRHLSDANRYMDLDEGIRNSEEAARIYRRLGDKAGEARCSEDLGWLCLTGGQFDAAEKATSRAIDLFAERGEQYRICTCHRLLGHIYQYKGETDKAIHNFKVALGVASAPGWHEQLFPLYCCLARLLLDEGQVGEAQDYLERAKLHVLNHTYRLGHAMMLQARIWRKQGRLVEARLEALRAADVYERFGAVGDLENCDKFLQRVEEEMNERGVPDDFD